MLGWVNPNLEKTLREVIFIVKVGTPALQFCQYSLTQQLATGE
jgi:hypothetical protein